MSPESERLTRKTRIDPKVHSAAWTVVLRRRGGIEMRIGGGRQAGGCSQ